MSGFDLVHVLDDVLVEVHAVGQCALEDVFVQAVDGAVLLVIDEQRREADAVGANFLVELGIGAAITQSTSSVVDDG